MADIQLNGQSITTTSATTAPAVGATETWTVTALGSGIPALGSSQTYALVDATSGATSSQQAEIIRVTACSGSGATSITVTRGADSTTPVAHSNPATFNIVVVATTFNALATQAYADSKTSKASVACATTKPLPANTYANGTAGVGATLTANANGALPAIDNYNPALLDRVLVKDEASGLTLGIYSVTQLGDGTHPWILTRATDADSASRIYGASTYVQQGSRNNRRMYVNTNSSLPTMGTTAIAFAQIPYLPLPNSQAYPLFIYGNSYSVNPGLRCTAGLEYFNQAAPLINAGTVTSYGVSATRIVDTASWLVNSAGALGGFPGVTGCQWPGVSSRTGIIIIECATNDIGHYPDMTLSVPKPAALPNNNWYAEGIKMQYKVALAVIASESRVEQSSATFGGTWGSQALTTANSSGGSIAYATTPAAVATYTITPPQSGPYAGRVYMLTDILDPSVGFMAPIDVSVDSGPTTRTFLTPWEQYKQPAAAQANTAQAVIAVDMPIDGASHTVSFTHAGASGQFMYTDCILIPSVTPNPVFVMQAPTPIANASTFTSTDVAVWARNSAIMDPMIQQAVAEFPSAHFVATNVTSNGLSSVDGLHPNDRGMEQRAYDFVTVVRDKLGQFFAARQAQLAPDVTYQTL